MRKGVDSFYIMEFGFFRIGHNKNKQNHRIHLSVWSVENLWSSRKQAVVFVVVRSVVFAVCSALIIFLDSGVKIYNLIYHETVSKQ